MHDQQNGNGHVSANSNTASGAVGAHADAVLAVPGGKAWRRLLAQGAPSIEELAALLKTIPQSAWSPLLLDAQRDPRLGNGFVQNALQLASSSTPTSTASATTSAVAAKPAVDGDTVNPRPIAHQKDAKGIAAAPPEFQLLPTGIKILDFSEGALIQELVRVADLLPVDQRVALARGWKARIEKGERISSVAAGGAVGNVQIGYKNAVQRDDGSYVADVTWRIFVSGEHGEDAREVVVCVGKLSYTAKNAAAIQVNNDGAARDITSLPLGPSVSDAKGRGPVTCHANSTVDEKCFLTSSEREEMLINTRFAVSTARTNFLAACESERARLKAAYDADQAFGMALVEMLFGFGMGQIVSFAAKGAGRVVAGKAPTEMDLWKKGLPSEPGIAEHAASTAAAAKGAADAMGVVGKLAAPAKKNLLDHLKPGIGSADALLVAIKAGSQHSFNQITHGLSAVTDEELALADSAFLNASEAGYVAMLQNYLPKFMKEVATIGEYDAPYSADFSERLVWAKDPDQGGKKRLARVRDFHSNMKGALTVPDQPDRGGREILGWVSEEMIPFALARHKRTFGDVEVLP
ncbi:MAG TPA: hypothetical protein PLF40_01080 [Kofleriaceae bacterium]|nr:hypothetical protein [Kofleriaceae bacterium]